MIALLRQKTCPQECFAAEINLHTVVCATLTHLITPGMARLACVVGGVEFNFFRVSKCLGSIIIDFRPENPICLTTGAQWAKSRLFWQK